MMYKMYNDITTLGGLNGLREHTINVWIYVEDCTDIKFNIQFNSKK